MQKKIPPESFELLLADDELLVRKSFRSLFAQEGYNVRVARDGLEALEKYREKRPDIILLDVMMPKMNGIAACEEIRKTDAVTPILFFTAMPSDVTLVRGLGSGADDYIEKNRSPQEFFARVGAALRRTERLSIETKSEPVVKLGAVTVDIADRSIHGLSEVHRLTRSEARLLTALIDRRGHLLSYRQLAEVLGGKDYITTEESIRKVLQRLKIKLAQAGDLIVVERGQGYRLLA